MSNELEILNQARRCVSEEQSSLQTECDAFRAFRETVSRAQPASAADTTSGTDTTKLVDAYKETVMSTPDYETAYGDSLVDSLIAEFSPPIANTLLSKNRITQQQKRNLLLATNQAIDQREKLQEILETERESLQRIHTTIADIKTTLETLPPCSIRHLRFDEYLDAWDTSDAQLRRCNRLLQNRQTVVTGGQQPKIPRKNDAYGFNEYLYHDLDTTYPALRAIAETRQCIEHYRGEESTNTSSEQREGPAVRR